MTWISSSKRITEIRWCAITGPGTQVENLSQLHFGHDQDQTNPYFRLIRSSFKRPPLGWPFKCDGCGNLRLPSVQENKFLSAGSLCWLALIGRLLRVPVRLQCSMIYPINIVLVQSSVVLRYSRNIGSRDTAPILLPSRTVADHFLPWRNYFEHYRSNVMVSE